MYSLIERRIVKRRLKSLAKRADYLSKIEVVKESKIKWKHVRDIYIKLLKEVNELGVD